MISGRLNCRLVRKGLRMGPPGLPGEYKNCACSQRGGENARKTDGPLRPYLSKPSVFLSIILFLRRARPLRKTSPLGWRREEISFQTPGLNSLCPSPLPLYWGCFSLPLTLSRHAFISRSRAASCLANSARTCSSARSTRPSSPEAWVMVASTSPRSRPYPACT